MATGRKSQLEKFDAKMAKRKAIEHQIEEENFKKSVQQKGIMDRGADYMNQVKPGTKTEDIAMAITHEGMTTFMKLWNNSMEDTMITTMKESIRPMVSEIVREVVQEELASAIKGVFAGLNETFKPHADIMIEKEPEPIVEEIQLEMPIEKIDGRKARKGIVRISKDVWMKELNELITSATIDPRVGLRFEKSGKRQRSLYQKFMQEHKGIKGAWKKHVESILDNK